MEQSILKSTRKILGIPEDDSSFDLDILTHINAAFTTLNQLGVGPAEGFFVEDEAAEWGEFTDRRSLLNLCRTYVYLKVRQIFDPPQTSYLTEALAHQIEQFEFRISVLRETTDWTSPVPTILPDVLDFGDADERF